MEGLSRSAAGRRSPRRGPALNGHIIDERGEIVARGFLGDDVAFVRATPSGDIWIGYGDEGCGGNLGWGYDLDGHGVCWSPAMQGLVKWSSGFDVRWLPPEQVLEPTAPTLMGEDILANEWPETILTSTGTRFDSKVASPLVALTDGSRYAVVGQGDNGHRTVILGHEGGPDGFVWDADGSLPGTYARPHEAMTIAGYGEVLNIWVGRRWFQVTLADLYGGVKRRTWRG